MNYLDKLPDELYSKVFKFVYNDSIHMINSIDFLPLKGIVKDVEFRYCYIKKNNNKKNSNKKNSKNNENRVLLYCDFFSYGPAHTDIEYVYIDFTIHKSTYVINNSILFYYAYAKRRYNERNILHNLDLYIISYYFQKCGYSTSKKIVYAEKIEPIPVNVIVYFQKCMDDENIN